MMRSSLIARFTPPNLEARRAAIGPVDGLPATLRRAFEPGDDFDPAPAPGPNDWLANHNEPGQTYEEFVHSGPQRPDARHRIIYLQPLGEFTSGESPPIDGLRQFAAAFFALEVAVLPSIAVTTGEVTTRRNPDTRHLQFLTTDILALLRRRLPADAYALLGITMEDLYPDDAWNFVFGQASPRHRGGVFSFARYDPRFSGQPSPGDRLALLLRRSVKVLAHETAHMFGVAHCIFFHCLMNGSNHLAESDARPLHLCPVDVRKLHYSIGFDVVARHQALRDVCERLGLADDARLLRVRLARIDTPEATAWQR
jgi:archaemetzincin